MEYPPCVLFLISVIFTIFQGDAGMHIQARPSRTSEATRGTRYQGILQVPRATTSRTLVWYFLNKNMVFIFFRTIFHAICIYIYIYMCVCVSVCVCFLVI